MLLFSVVNLNDKVISEGIKVEQKVISVGIKVAYKVISEGIKVAYKVISEGIKVAYKVISEGIKVAVRCFCWIHITASFDELQCHLLRPDLTRMSLITSRLDENVTYYVPT